jgi:RHS repeat-associated protein
VAQTTETLYHPSGGSHGVRTSYAYSPVTDKPLSKTLEVVTNGNSSFTEHYRYDALGRCVCDSVPHFKQTLRTYDQHGWLLSSQTLRMTGAYIIDHCQRLRYADGAHPCYSGRISGVNTYTGGTWKGFNLEYDSLGRIVNAEGTVREDMLPQGAAHSESLEYDANGNITVLSRYGSYGGQFGQTDFMQMTYTGNRLTGVYDVVGQPVYAGTFGFSNGTGQNRYSYDKCGSMLWDKNRGIALIDYDDRGYPSRIQFTDGNVTDYVYASDGRRLRMRHLTAVEGITVAAGSRHELTVSEILSKDSVEYMGSFQVSGNKITRFDFADGYATYRPNVPADVLDFHFLIRDHQGSVAAVFGNGTTEQRTRYYPFGGLMTQDCTGEGVNADKYTGKRLDRMHGLDWYDYGARQYDPVYGRFASIDPLCEKYPHLSPYAYCGNDPVNFVDPDGKDYFVIVDEKKKTKTITANYYAMSEDMDALNYALSFWNGLSYDIDGYKVGFDLKAIEVTEDYLNTINENMHFRDKEHALTYILKKEYTEDINLLLPDQRHNNVFMIGDIPDSNVNGNTNNNIIRVRASHKEEMTGAHEVGHSLGFEHARFGLMTPSSSEPKRKGFEISKGQVKSVIKRARNYNRYINDKNFVGIGFTRFTK